MLTTKILKNEQSIEIFELIQKNKLNWSYTTLISSLANDTCFSLGIYQESNLVGFIIYSIVEPEASLELIGIATEHQQVGIGSQLLKESEQKLIPKNISTIFLEVSEKNHATAFYKKHKYHQIGIRKKYYPDGSDALLMKKEL